MNLNKKYRLTLEDESSLEKKINFSARFPILLLMLIGFTVVAGAFGIFILASTPMKNHLPGYLKESERTATEEQHLRLDSLVHVYEVNEAYITGILNALTPPEIVERDRKEKRTTPLMLDSLLPVSEEERQFMENIREREKYNIGYSSPTVAQTMMFGNVNKSAVITESSKESYQADIIIPEGQPVATIAEGKVISIASSPKTSGSYEVIIQHPKGFLSKTSRLRTLLVRPGDRVAAGQIIATGTAKDGMKNQHIKLELWRDGDPLIPARYLTSIGTTGS
ncbi:MAG: peptidoglycan DD-metalloendopeptidase family protein [Muribaculaceae bacterium]|nr:peptidoglycan DD-metalloendopeptidase family protein [Muribaculaceae bacterium]